MRAKKDCQKVFTTFQSYTFDWETNKGKFLLGNGVLYLFSKDIFI